MARDWDADTLERIVHAALADGDIKAVEAALTLMAPRDPHRAQRLLDDLREALAIARGAEPEIHVRAKR
jgi:hypothetical protein